MATWTKRDIIMEALNEIGMGSYDYDATPEDIQSAARKLDAMMGVWINNGIVFTTVYPLPTSPKAGDISVETNAPDYAVEPMYLGLAIKLAPSYGKQISMDSKVAFKRSYNSLLRNYTVPTVQSLGNFLVGAGNKLPVDPWIEDAITDINTLA